MFSFVRIAMQTHRKRTKVSMKYSQMEAPLGEVLPHFIQRWEMCGLARRNMSLGADLEGCAYLEILNSGISLLSGLSCVYKPLLHAATSTDAAVPSQYGPFQLCTLKSL